MIIFDILAVICNTFVFMYILADLVCSIRNKKLQKEWNREKAARLRIDPAITKAELCEYYVMFLKRNTCNVEF
jgi:hypothetical protein